MAAKTKTKKLDQYLKDAKIGPFTLDLGDDQIVIEPPSGDALIALGEIPLSQTRKILALVCGEHYERIMGIVGPKSYEVLQGLMLDLIDHFQINQGQAALPGGGPASRTS